MSAVGITYAAVTKDTGEYAYVNMGWLALTHDRARRSGIVYDMKDVGALLKKLNYALGKSIYSKQQAITYHSGLLTEQRLKDELERLQKMEFDIVKITVEPVDPTLY